MVIIIVLSIYWAIPMCALEMFAMVCKNVN